MVKNLGSSSSEMVAQTDKGMEIVPWGGIIGTVGCSSLKFRPYEDIVRGKCWIADDP